MAALGRDAAKQPTGGGGRKPLPDGPGARRPSGTQAGDQPQSAEMKEALTGLRALEDKLRWQLEKDKQRLHHDRRISLSTQPSGSGSDASEASGANSGTSRASKDESSAMI
ncbi:hypothetical protein NKR19_g9949 [Coniochaeta hoffmannii]|uniref:Uncharacterized protein n=1 Tax=Coniochaeta hoffmannii TaxID=91930 RepID=A0AA38REY8_9PEZI|nr:hypothetical protein NKR19_g9949 [Coniochaeta hoffmannii]